LAGVAYGQIPPVALLCNVIVVTGGVWHFTRNGHFEPRLFWPFVVTSMPFAFLGGRIPIPQDVFLVLLGVTLSLAGLRQLVVRVPDDAGDRETGSPWLPACAIGAVLGLVSGMVGIGGGIFLAPVLLSLRWGRPKQVAATCAWFILVNSLAGLLGQLVKSGTPTELLEWWPLALAVLAGGQIGSRLGARSISQRGVRLATAALVLVVGVRVLVEAMLD
jgi:uncharacterized membrane protein YfcA